MRLGLTVLDGSNLLGHKRLEDVVEAVALEKHGCPFRSQLLVLGVIYDLELILLGLLFFICKTIFHEIRWLGWGNIIANGGR